MTPRLCKEEAELIRIVACVGAGIVGQGWATLFSLKGLQVNLQDSSTAAIKKAVRRVEANLALLEKKRFLQKGESKLSLDKIETTSKISDAVNEADYVQESVPDAYEVKKRVFKEIGASCPQHAILASSTSGLLMSEIQKSTSAAERCVIAHPVVPQYIIPLVEIMGGEKTSKQTIQTTYDFMVGLGKKPVVLNKEIPGFIVNRLQAAIWREAVSLVANGVASAEDVDKAFCFGIGLRDPILGPCLRAHLAGGGIENFIRKYDESYGGRWRTMENWTAMPYSEALKIIKSVCEMKVVRAKDMKEIERLRDEKLIEIFKAIVPSHPFYT
jgi:3-hydroxypropionate dehydrogenase (NADP+)